MNDQELILSLLKARVKNSQELNAWNRWAAKTRKRPLFSNTELLQLLRQYGQASEVAGLLPVLRRRAIRTLSGIAPVAVLTKPYPCPGNCAFCPSEKNVPQSYLSNEPAVMRAIRCGYDPYVQVQDRLRALIANGHEPVKIEIIVIGGTWSYLPKKYKYWYIANCFKAANDFTKNWNLSPAGELKKTASQLLGFPVSRPLEELRKNLKQEQVKNERSRHRIIGLTLETRPDYINEKELRQMRELGCTRVEIGVQAVDDEILNLNRRGHGVKEIVEATARLRSFGFKITYHLMPGLPGATPARDFELFQLLFTDKRFQPDQIKFYPTVVTKGSLMHRWWKQGKFKPYSTKQLESLIIKCKSIIPEYVRVIRLIRDIPGESILAGNMVTNLRQVMKNRGVKCNCIRCREIKGQITKIKDWKFDLIKYKVSGGEEIFLQAVTKDHKLLGFCRLFLPESAGKAMVRELHVYGELAKIGQAGKVQHKGLGKKLLKKAEEYAKKKKFKTILIISGIGVRGYYRKNGYRLKDTYMVKNL